LLLSDESAPFGINTTIVEPGFFRTGLLTPTSTIWAENSIEDYAAKNAELRPFWQSMNGKQGGDPAKLAEALIRIASENEPPQSRRSFSAPHWRIVEPIYGGFESFISG